MCSTGSCPHSSAVCPARLPRTQLQLLLEVCGQGCLKLPSIHQGVWWLQNIKRQGVVEIQHAHAQAPQVAPVVVVMMPQNLPKEQHSGGV